MASKHNSQIGYKLAGIAITLGTLLGHYWVTPTDRILDNARASGLTLFLLVYWYLSKATPELLLTMLVPVAIVFALAVLAVAVTTLRGDNAGS